jgi:hypothetical protein
LKVSREWEGYKLNALKVNGVPSNYCNVHMWRNDMQNGNLKMEQEQKFARAGGVKYRRQQKPRPDSDPTINKGAGGKVTKGDMYLYKLASGLPRQVFILQNPDASYEGRQEVDKALAKIVQITAEVQAHTYAGREPRQLWQETGYGIFTTSEPLSIDDSNLQDLAELIDKGEMRTFHPKVKLGPIGADPIVSSRALAFIGSGNKNLLEHAMWLIDQQFSPDYWGYSLGGDPDSPIAESYLWVNLTDEEVQEALDVGPNSPGFAMYQKVLVQWSSRVAL